MGRLILLHKMFATFCLVTLTVSTSTRVSGAESKSRENLNDIVPEEHRGQKANVPVLERDPEGVRYLESDHEAPRSVGTSDVGDDEEEERVEFTAFLKKHNTHPPPPPPPPASSRCRPDGEKRTILAFDTTVTTTTTTTSHRRHHHHAFHDNAFNAPYDGVYIFALKLQVHHQPPHAISSSSGISDIHVVTDNGDTVICSVSSSSAKGRTTPQYDADADSTLAKIRSVSDSQGELLTAVWDVEAEMNRLARIAEWSQPPQSPWERKPGTDVVEGGCEGVKHLHRGQRVFVVTSGSLSGDVSDVRYDDAGDDVDVDDFAGLCDVLSGSFSGSIFAKDM